MGLKRCKFDKKSQLKLLEFFVLEETTRSAAAVFGLQANTAALFLRGHPASWPCRVTGPPRSASARRCSAKNDSPNYFYGLTPRAGAIAPIVSPALARRKARLRRFSE
jgi:hypothetical protein